MDAALIAALEAASPCVVHLVTLTLPDRTVRWTDGGFVVWAGQTYAARDAVHGVIDALEDVEDGVSDGATTWDIDLFPPSDESWALLTAPEAQGSPLTVHRGAVNRQTGLLIGTPEPLHAVELDTPRLSGAGERLTYGCVTADALLLEPNDGQTLSHSFHTWVWGTGELGLANVTTLPRKRYWRADTPNNAIS